MAIAWRQLLTQFLVMMLLYFLIVIVLIQLGIDSLVLRVGVALLVAFGYPALLRRIGRAPPAWQRD